MKKRINYQKAAKVTVFIVFLAFAAIQFIPKTLNQNDVIAETDIMKRFEVPAKVQKILKTSCYDCHSNNTNYPWYSRIQPAAWYLEGHITEGKNELNFSEFGDYSNRRQKSKLKSIVSQIGSGEMPLPSYTYIHWEAKLSEQEKQLLTDWLNSVKDGL